MAPIVTTLEEQAETVRRRLKALGRTSYPIPKNAGHRRTESKKALLEEIDRLRRADQDSGTDSDSP